MRQFPSLQARWLTSPDLSWQPLPLEGGLADQLPACLRDQVFQLFLAEVPGGHLADCVVAEQFPRDSLDVLLSGLMRLPFQRLLLLVSHERSNSAQLMVSQRDEGVAYHIDLNLHQPTRLEQEILSLLARLASADFDALFCLLREQRSHEAFHDLTRDSLLALGPLTPRSRQRVLELILALVFLLFVQRKGWLNFDPYYLAQAFDRCCRQGLSILQTLLKPLFATLEGRGEAGSPIGSPMRLGALPRLGGGLFDLPFSELPAIENQWFTRWLSACSQRFTFSLFEDRPHRQICGVSPAILGEVFENLMDAGDRKQYGVFFTPMGVVQHQVRLAFTHWQEALPAEGPIREEALRGIRILDPACGSGSFLVAALQQLLEMRLAFEPERARYNGQLYQLKKDITTRNLFGLDIHPFAVRLSEVRLWLHMIQDLQVGEPDQAPALPSLQHHLRCGDFLARKYQPSGVPPWPGRARLEKLKASLPSCNNAQRRLRYRHMLRLEGLWAKYLEEQEQEQSRAFLKEQRKQLLLPLELPAGQGRPRKKPDRSGRPCKSFQPHILFSRAMEEGGFDLILGNPPWVAATATPASSRQHLPALYREHQLPHDAKADLALHFLLLSTPLLRPGGCLSMVLPARICQARFAAGARSWLQQQLPPFMVLDYSDRQDLLFQADTFPVILGLSARKPADGQVYVEHHTRHLTRHFRLPLQELTAGQTWCWLENCNRVQARLADLGWPIQRGIVTGDKRNFTHSSPLGPQWKPLLRGRDIAMGAMHPGAFIYWPFGPQKEPTGCQGKGVLKMLGKHAVPKGGAQPGYAPRNFGPLLVIWKYLGKRMLACLVRGVRFIPDQTTYYIQCDSFALAWKLFQYLNRPATQEYWPAIAQRGKDHHFFFYAHTVLNLPLDGGWDACPPVPEQVADCYLPCEAGPWS